MDTVEIGDINDFSSASKLAGWLGLVPNVYHSAGKCHMGSITKRISVHARWILTQTARAVVRCRDNIFRTFYESKKKAIGVGKSIIAVARKIVTILWHLLKNNEEYVSPLYTAKKPRKHVNVRIPRELTIDELLELLMEANIYLKKPDSDII